MSRQAVATPGPDIDRRWVLECGQRYWRVNSDKITALPLRPSAAGATVDENLRYIVLPNWAEDIGVNGKLLVFESSINLDGRGEEWERCDWVATAFHMLSSSLEKQFEAEGGSNLSYAFRLPHHLSPLFDRAWVNRIFLFLRRWAAHLSGVPEEALFGKMPKGIIHLTHDLDAIRLTPEIRMKQTVFQLINSTRAVAARKMNVAAQRLRDASRYLFASGELPTLRRLSAMERAADVSSLLHVYGGPPGFRRLSPRRILIDPAYDVATIAPELRAFANDGHKIGLHQSFDAWVEAKSMAREKAYVERAIGFEITHCRQHWLHFSFRDTWKAQREAGLSCDSTLGFNDRPGFRASHALPVHPLRHVGSQFLALPMVLMDSHLYDYSNSSEDHERVMKNIIDEIVFVGGEATVNWHPHTITPVYGWEKGFECLLALLSEVRSATV